MSEETVTTESKPEFSLSQIADEIIPNEKSTSASSSTDDQSGDKQTAPPQTSDQKTDELTPEQILGEVAKQAADPKANEELLKLVNELGAIHNGLPVKIESKDQLKELVQKGYDYTKKTMEHAEITKSFKDEQVKMQEQWKQREETFAKQESQLADVIIENQIAEVVLKQMQAEDPDLFSEFSRRFQAEITRRNAEMPLVRGLEQQLQGVQKQIEELRGGNNAKELQTVKANFEKEMSATQTQHAATLAKLGVQVDWKKVQNTWEADATGKMTVEQALHANYGTEISKAYQSYKKLLETKNKTSNAMLKKTGVGSSAGVAETSQAAKSGDLRSYLKEALAQM